MDPTLGCREVWEQALTLAGPEKGVRTPTIRLLVPRDGKHRFGMLRHIGKDCARLIHREGAPLRRPKPRKCACVRTHDVAVENTARTWLLCGRVPEVGGGEISRREARQTLLDPETLPALDVRA